MADSLIEKYCVVHGLQSPNAKGYNGQKCLVVKRDVDACRQGTTTASASEERVAVLFVDKIGCRAEFVSLKCANLTPIYQVDVRNSTLGGKGLFALQPFNTGAIVFEEKPVAVSNSFEAVDRNMNRLSDAENEALSHLTMCEDASFPQKHSQWAKRFANNCITCGDNGEMALYPVMCRINHSCILNTGVKNPLTTTAPSNNVNETESDRKEKTNTGQSITTVPYNVRWAWDARRGVQYLTAARPIEAGEELLTDYISDTVWGEDRVDNLRVHGIVECTCQLCRPSGTTRRLLAKYSDAKQRLLSKSIADVRMIDKLTQEGLNSLTDIEKLAFSDALGGGGECKAFEPFGNLKSLLHFNKLQNLVRLRKSATSLNNKESNEADIVLSELSEQIRSAADAFYIARLQVVGGCEAHPYMEMPHQLLSSLGLDPRK